MDLQLSVMLIWCIFSGFKPLLVHSVKAAAIQVGPDSLSLPQFKDRVAKLP